MDNKDKQALIDGTATIPYKLHILNNDGTIKDTLIEEDIVSTDYEDYRYVDSSSLCIGQFVARKLKGEVKILDKDLQIEDKEISVEMGVNRNDGSKVYDITIDGKSEQNGTPTPDKPVEIKSVEGIENLLNVSNTDKIINGVTFTKNGDGTITVNGTTTATTIYNLLENSSLTLKKGTYILSGCPNGGSDSTYKLDIPVGSYPTDYGASTKVIVNEETTYNSMRIVIYSGVTLNDVIFKPMLSKTFHDYVPYGHWLKVKNTGKNSFSSKLEVGGIDTTTGLNVANNTRKRTKDFILIQPNTTYTFSYKNQGNYAKWGWYILYDNNQQIVSSYTFENDYDVTFTSPNDTYYFKMYFGNAENVDVNSFNCQLEKGTEPTKYEPYQEQSMLIDMNKYDKNGNIIDYYELCSIDNTKDELNIDKDGNVSITQNIGESVLDGTETGWGKSGATGNASYYYSAVYGTSGYKFNDIDLTNVGTTSSTTPVPAYCDYFQSIAGNKIFTDIKGLIFDYISNTKTIELRLGFGLDTTITTVDLLKTWLSTHPVTVKYILAEPQTISLGKYNKIENIDDTENITIQTNIDTTFTKISYNLVNWYNLGNFLITKPTDDDVKDTLTFDSMDYTKKFNKSFDASGINFPCTALQLAKYCCEECNVELATTEFLNYDFEVIDNQYTNEDTFRNVMQDIGKLAYSWVRIGWDNKCYIDFNYGKEVDEYNKIDNDNYYDLELQQKTFGPVNRVIIGMSDVEGENVYIEDEESIAEYGVTELQIYDNNLTYTPELRNKVIDSAKVLFGLTYTPMTLNTTGHPWFLGNEKVEVTGMDNTIYYMYPWDRTITYSGHIKSKLDSKGETKTETEYKYKGDVESVLKKTRIIVNKQEGTITSLTQTTTTIQDNLQQNYYDKTQTNRLIQTSGEGITNTFSEAGGNNIFRNTGLWFEDSSTSYYIYPKSDLYPSNQTFTNRQRAYEFWDGLILKEYYDKAANLTSLLLQNGYFEQKQQVPNGNYTVSFKYKKLIESATTKVIINNVEYNLTKLEDTEFRTGEQDSDGNYITQPLEVTDGYIFVRFYTNVNNSTIIYDLMVNAGSVKLAYSQNQNETTTDTVNISKGITITSSNTDTTFKANSDGIRTLNKNNETLSEFTDKGMKNKQIEVTDEATIVQVLWQNVGDQTWLTRL